MMTNSLLSQYDMILVAVKILTNQKNFWNRIFNTNKYVIEKKYSSLYRTRFQPKNHAVENDIIPKTEKQQHKYLPYFRKMFHSHRNNDKKKEKRPQSSKI